ncbi:hypothetical protein [Vibrio sp.]|uniref:hypothetical protein n=1 Tax=Vibrio sp. TaxID=678 RepID=UPI0031203B4E
MKKPLVAIVIAGGLGLAGYQWFSSNSDMSESQSTSTNEQTSPVVLSEKSVEQEAIPDDVNAQNTSSVTLAKIEAQDIQQAPELIDQAQTFFSAGTMPKDLSDKELAAEFSAISEFIDSSGLISRINEEAFDESQLEVVKQIFERHDSLGIEQAQRQFRELAKLYPPEELERLNSELDDLEAMIKEAEALMAEIDNEEKLNIDNKSQS